MSEIKKLEDRRAELWRKMDILNEELNDCIAAGKTELTEEQAARSEALVTEYKIVKLRIDECYQALTKEKALPAMRDVNQNTDQENFDQHGHIDGANGHLRNLTAPGESWFDGEGRKIKLLSATERLGDQKGKRSGIHFGRMLLGLATGNWRNADTERQYLAQAGGINTSGGYLVDEQLSREILDLARAQSVVMRAGARTFEMSSDSLVLAKQTADATFSHVGENQTITESELTFGALTFTAGKVAAIVTCSNELLQDASNAADKIQSALVSALAVELDRQALVGTGSAQFLGLMNNSNISSTGSVGAIAWEDINAAAVAVMTNNYRANGYVAHPEIYSDATMQTSGDGTTSAKLWLPPPPIVAELTPFITTAITTANILVGQFDQAAWGIRLGMGGEVQMSNVAGDSFEKYQTKIRCVFRGDFLPLQTGAFFRLTGVTT